MKLSVKRKCFFAFKNLLFSLTVIFCLLMGKAYAAGFNEAMQKQKDTQILKDVYLPINRNPPKLYWPISSIYELDQEFIELKNDKGVVVGSTNISHVRAFQKATNKLMHITGLGVKVAYLPGGPPDIFATEVDGQNLILINLEMLDVINGNTDEFVVLVGHVLAHIYNEDEKSRKSALGMGLLIGFMAANEIVRRDNVKKEIKADEMTLTWMSEAKYDISATISLYERLLKLAENNGPNWINIYVGGKRRLETLRGIVDRKIDIASNETKQNNDSNDEVKQILGISAIPEVTEKNKVYPSKENTFVSSQKTKSNINTTPDSNLVLTTDGGLNKEIENNPEKKLAPESLNLRTRAIKGDVESQFVVGEKHYKGDGVIKDYVEAYLWLNLAAANGHKTALKSREKLEKKMTPNQIAEGQKLSRDWIQKHSN